MVPWLTSSPTLKSSVSPGRKKPSSRPHSAKMMKSTPQSAYWPNEWTSVFGSSQPRPVRWGAITSPRVTVEPHRASQTPSMPNVAVPERPAHRHDAPGVSVGVGPWPGTPPTAPHLDPDLLRDGDRRNVADRYRYWRLEAIVAD